MKLSKQIKTITGLVTFAFLSALSLTNAPLKAGLGSDPDCPNSGNADEMSSNCFQTPTVMEVPFYELGFCTSDPLSGFSFSRDNCEKAWDSSTPQTIDLAKFSYSGLTSGLTYKIPNKTYTHAYVIVGNNWGLKSEVYFNNTTYYSDENGSATQTAADFSKFNDTITSMSGTETPDNCYDYQNSTDYGPIKAVITDSSLNTASNSSTCDSAVRLIGSIDLDNDLTMSDSVKSYNLTWIVKKMGIFVQNGGTAPNRFYSGPFVPNFELSK